LQTAALRQLFDAPLVNGGPDEQAARALAGMLAVFAEFERDILRDRVKAGIAQARQEGRPHGRPATVRRHADKVRKLHTEGVSKSEIARRLSVSRTSVRRLLEP
jgi:putative DNA-invertase from lambdoid prophage Rac